MYLLEIDKRHKELLVSIRHWDTVKIAFTETEIWLKDFSAAQLNSPELLQLPHLVFYEVKDNLLFIKGSLLPSKKVPSALLWSPIQKALPLTLPSLNHNYFGVAATVDVRILKSGEEQQAFALLTSIAAARDYIENAPQVRLSPLQWVVLEDKVLILGQPLLHIKGEAFWRKGNALLPAGFDFELPVLAAVVDEKINPSSENIVVWQRDSSYVSIPKSSIMPLTISSFKLTFN